MVRAVAHRAANNEAGHMPDLNLSVEDLTGSSGRLPTHGATDGLTLHLLAVVGKRICRIDDHPWETSISAALT